MFWGKVFPKYILFMYFSAETCRSPPLPVGVTIATMSSGAYKKGSIVEYTCDRPGYTMQGNHF